MKNRQKVFDKTDLRVLGYLGIKFEKREAYAVAHVSELLTMYKETTGLDETSFVSGMVISKNNTKNCMNIGTFMHIISRPVEKKETHEQGGYTNENQWI